MKKTILFIFVAMNILQMNAANCPMANGWKGVLSKPFQSARVGTNDWLPGGGPAIDINGALSIHRAQEAVQAQLAVEELARRKAEQQRIRDEQQQAVLAVLNDVPLEERPSFIGSLLGSLGTMLSEGMRTPPDAFTKKDRPAAPDSRPTSPIEVR